MRRSWLLHRQLSSLLTEGSLEEWRPVIERNLPRLRSSVTGQPHTRNLDRWNSLVERGDVLGLHRVLTGLDRDSIEMREVGRREVIVVGSQSILGTFREDQLPNAATMPVEADILPIADDNDETARLANLIDGVDLETSALPAGWRDRLVKVQNANTAAPGGEPQYVGWCIDKEGLCVAKLGAFREKDQNFVAALARSALADRETILTRLATVDERYRGAAGRASSWLRSLETGN